MNTAVMGKGMLVGVCALVLSACSSNPLKEVWAAPDAEKIDFKKTFVVAEGPSESVRRGAEEALVRDMFPLNGSPAYKVMDEKKLKDVEAAKAFVKENGYDGALVVKYLGTRQEIRETMSAGPAYGFYGYYGRPYGGYGYGGSTIDTKNISSVEMSIFSLKQDKLIWSGYLEISNPRDVDTVISRLSEAALNDLRARGLL